MHPPNNQIPNAAASVRRPVADNHATNRPLASNKAGKFKLR